MKQSPSRVTPERDFSSLLAARTSISFAGCVFRFGACYPSSQCLFRTLHLLGLNQAVVPFLIRCEMPEASAISIVLHFFHDENYCCFPAFVGACKSSICRAPPPPPRSPPSP